MEGPVRGAITIALFIFSVWILLLIYIIKRGINIIQIESTLDLSTLHQLQQSKLSSPRTGILAENILAGNTCSFKALLISFISYFSAINLHLGNLHLGLGSLKNGIKTRSTIVTQFIRDHKCDSI